MKSEAITPRTCHRHSFWVSMGFSLLVCLGLLFTCQTTKAQGTNWNGTWTGSFNRAIVLPCGNGDTNYTDSGALTLALSVTNGNVTGSIIADNGFYCYNPSSCVIEEYYNATSSISGSVSGSAISINFGFTPTSGPCSGNGATAQISGTNNGAGVITGIWDGTYSTGSFTLNGPTGTTNTNTATNTVAVNTNKILGCQCSCSSPATGEPIRIATGNMFQEVADYSTAAENPLQFTRYYNSQADRNTMAVMLGVNWRSTYDRYLRLSTSITAERADGQELIFTNNGSLWSSDSDVDVQLLQSGSVWTLIDSDDTIETYNGNGFLTSIQARDGYTQTLQYNGNNQLASVTDSFGRMLQLTYQGNLLQTVTAPNGLVLTYGYTSSGVTPGILDQLASVTYSTTPASSQSYLYENSGLPFALTGIIDENGNRYATWTYDSSGRATSSQLGNRDNLTTIAYNTDGSRDVTNALGEVMVYKFTTLQGVPKATEIDRLATASVPAATMIYTYDNNGYIDSISDWNTNLTTLANDTRDEPLITSEAIGTAAERTTTATYLTNFHLPLQIVAPRKTTTFTYDTNGNPVTITEADATTQVTPYLTRGQTRSWINTYDNLGHLLTSTGPRTDLLATNRFNYDTSNDLIAITDPLGHPTRLTNYNGSGLPGKMIDPNGVVTTFAYDVRNRLLSRTVQAASGNATDTFGYDAVGNLTSIMLPNGTQFDYQYDAAHRLESASNLLGESITCLLDAAGNITNQAVRNSGGQIVKTQKYVFDQLSRVLQQIGAYSETTTFGYDSDGNRISVTDARTNTTAVAFDALNRLIKAVDPLEDTTSFTYDSQDNLDMVTDPRLLSTHYTYDGFGRVIEETSPDTGSTVYYLDEAGNRTNQVDARNVTTLRTFDRLNRVTSETFPASSGENITYAYDATNGGNFGVGRLTGYTDESGSTTLAYNERGDVISTVQINSGTTYTTTYGYDLADYVTNIVYPSGHIIAYKRDSQGRISSVTYYPSAGGTPVALASNVNYMPFGPVSGFQYGNGLTRTLAYDLDYRLAALSTAGTSSHVQNLTYGYDAASDITSIKDNLAAARSQSFAYDPDYRLTGASGLYGTASYTYDPDGNRVIGIEGGIATHYFYSNNRLQEVTNSGGSETFAYTANGNLSTATGAAGDTSFYYGNLNRYNYFYGGSTLLGEYSYNALGERAFKGAYNTGANQFQYDQRGHMISVSDPGGSLVWDYVWLGDMPLAQIESSGTVHFVHPDHLNTPQKLTDAGGNIVWDNEQTPFGENTPLTFSNVRTGNKQVQMDIYGIPAYNYVLQTSTNLARGNWLSLATNTGSITFTDAIAATIPQKYYRSFYQPTPVYTDVLEALRFPGQYLDSESELNYNMMRDYDPTLGRYLEGDPIGLRGGVNLYGYANGNPVKLTDKFGLQVYSEEEILESSSRIREIERETDERYETVKSIPEGIELFEDALQQLADSQDAAGDQPYSIDPRYLPPSVQQQFWDATKQRHQSHGVTVCSAEYPDGSPPTEMKQAPPQTFYPILIWGDNGWEIKWLNQPPNH
jgi:RHS repeat-associated protein